jgi:hypothetical protein
MLFVSKCYKQGHSSSGVDISCGDVFEYLHRSPENHRSQRKWNPVPGAITWPSSFWGIQIRGPGLRGWGSLESETVKYGHESRGTRTRQCLLWLGPAAIVNDRLILSLERMLHKDYDREGSVGKKNTGRESQGA